VPSIFEAELVGGPSGAVQCGNELRYFTPELIERFGSLDDDIADAAQHEWDETSGRYRTHVASIARHLPRQFRTLLEEYRLHDARVALLGAVPNGTGQLFRLELISETAPEQPLMLTYVLAPNEQPLFGGTDIRSASNGSADLTRERYWLYDEVDIVSGGASPTLSHTILFADGMELVLHFTSFQLASVPLSARA
jgi:hypothetical protein